MINRLSLLLIPLLLSTCKQQTPGIDRSLLRASESYGDRALTLIRHYVERDTFEAGRAIDAAYLEYNRHANVVYKDTLANNWRTHGIADQVYSSTFRDYANYKDGAQELLAFKENYALWGDSTAGIAIFPKNQSEWFYYVNPREIAQGKLDSLNGQEQIHCPRNLSPHPEKTLQKFYKNEGEIHLYQY